MAPPEINSDVKSREKDVHYYTADLETVNEPARRLLEKYSGIPPDQVVPHILEIVSHQCQSAAVEGASILPTMKY